MFERISAAVFVFGLLTGPAFSQVPPNPTQQTVVTPSGELPVFRVTVIGRTIPAINYRPRSGDTRINFAGTALIPKAKGWASIEGEKGYIKIDARFDELGAPMQFGREYLTYVLWAITPEGRANNLGELQVNDDDGACCGDLAIVGYPLPPPSEPSPRFSVPSLSFSVPSPVRSVSV